MKKLLLLLMVALLLCAFVLPAAASAEGTIIVNLGSVRAGGALDMLMGTTETGTAALVGGSLPDNCSIVTEEKNGQAAHYLRGTPMTAGNYEFSLAVTETVTRTVESTPAPAEDGAEGTDEPAQTVVETVTETVSIATLTCSLTVYPAVPSFSVQDLDCFVGEDVTLSLTASVTDGGTISYQWYVIDVRDNSQGKLLENETGSSMKPDTEFVGTSYYYCVIVNNNNGMTESQVTPAITVKVEEPAITSVSIATLPEKLEYTEGDSVDPKGLTLLVRYSNGMNVTDNEGFTITPEKLDKPGTQTVTVTYQNNTCTFPVIVNEDKEVVEGIAVQTLPDKREYRVGDWLDTRGLVLMVATNKGNRSEVSTGYQCEPSVLTASGIQTITVTYEEKTTSFTVTVLAADKVVQQIEVDTLPTKLAYQVGETFDSSGMVLKVITDQGNELVRSGFTCTPSRFTKEGTQTVTVSYGGKTCSLELTVSPSAAAETPAPAATAKPAVPRESARPAPAQPSRSSGGGNGFLVAVILIAGLLSLVALGAYLYVSNPKLFRKGKKKQAGKQDKR